MQRKNVIIAGAALLVLILVIILSSGRKSKEIVPATDRSGILKAAEEAYAEGNFLTAKDAYEHALTNITDPSRIEGARKKLEQVNMAILFSSVMDECSSEYVVQPNDNLGKIAKKHNTTVGLLKRSNRLSSDIIRPGQRLKVSACPFSLAADKSQNLLFLKRQGEIFKTYVVSTGRDNCTPVGEFRIVTKLVRPTWFKTGAVIPPDSEENILGTRWMGFNEDGYGIHGTTEPEKLGQQVTSGCIRMRNDEVEELYDIVPMGTKITIVD